MSKLYNFVKLKFYSMFSADILLVEFLLQVQLSCSIMIIIVYHPVLARHIKILCKNVSKLSNDTDDYIPSASTGSKVVLNSHIQGLTGSQRNP